MPGDRWRAAHLTPLLAHQSIELQANEVFTSHNLRKLFRAFDKDRDQVGPAMQCDHVPTNLTTGERHTTVAAPYARRIPRWAAELYGVAGDILDALLSGANGLNLVATSTSAGSE